MSSSPASSTSSIAAVPARAAGKRFLPPRIFLGVAAILLAVAVTYIPALDAGFIWDDEANVTENATLRSVDGLWQMWFVPRSIQQYYPLMYTSYWVEYQLWGLAPFGYHLVNILLHAVAALLVWRVLVVLRVPGAFLAAAIFAVHPVEVESVAWITERKNVLSLMLALLSLLAYFRFDPLEAIATEEVRDDARWHWYLTALALFALALFAKTVVVTLPAVLLVILWWQRGRIEVRDIVRLLPFFALAIALGLVTTWMETSHVGAQGEEWNLSPLARLLLAGRALWFYIGKLVWPYPLAFFYPALAIDVQEGWQYLYPLAALIVPAMLWAMRFRIGRGPLAAYLIYAGVMFPMLGFFNIYYARFAPVSDHFQYHASIALIALAAAGAAQAIERMPPATQILPKLMLGVLLVLFAVLSYRQTFIYHDLETLYRDTIVKNPAGWTAYSNLSSHLDALGRHDEALDLAATALRLGPHEPNVHNNLGVFLFQKGMREGFRPGQLDDAITHLRDTLALDPDRIEARKNLARAFVVAGRPAEAVAEYEAALRTNANRADLHFELANQLVAREDFAAAREHYEAAVRLQPDYVDALQNFGAVLLKMGDAAAAIPYFETVLRLEPDSSQARANLEYAKAQQGLPPGR